MSAPTGPDVNLVTEPWLPVAMLDGTTVEMSLKEVFARAHEAKGLATPSPLVYTAILRYLIAIHHRAIDGPANPDDWASRWERGRFDRGEIDRYLDQWRHRFELFDPEMPFAQTPKPLMDWKLKPISQLMMERASGSNTTLFDHSRDDKPLELSPAEAARALVANHAFAFAGGGVFFHSTMINGYHLSLEGNSLFHTLMLNTQQYDQERPIGLTKGGDAPWWEWQSSVRPKREAYDPIGLTDLLTWMSRSVLLVPEPDGSVRSCWYGPGPFLKESDIRDPFKRYEWAKLGANQIQLRARDFRKGRALWRDSHSIIEQQESSVVSDERNPLPRIIEWLAEATYQLDDEIETPSIVATGIINDKAKMELWRMDRLALPLPILRDQDLKNGVTAAVDSAQRVRDALFFTGKRTVEELLGIGERSPDPNDVKREREGLKLEERYWSQLDAEFQELLFELATADGPSDPVRTWRQMLYRLAQRVFIEATNAAGLNSRWFRAQAIGQRVLNGQLRRALGEDLFSNSGNQREAAD